MCNSSDPASLLCRSGDARRPLGRRSPVRDVRDRADPRVCSIFVQVQPAFSGELDVVIEATSCKGECMQAGMFFASSPNPCARDGRCALPFRDCVAHREGSCSTCPVRVSWRGAHMGSGKLACSVASASVARTRTQVAAGFGVGRGEVGARVGRGVAHHKGPPTRAVGAVVRRGIGPGLCAFG